MNDVFTSHANPCDKFVLPCLPDTIKRRPLLLSPHTNTINFLYNLLSMWNDVILINLFNTTQTSILKTYYNRDPYKLKIKFYYSIKLRIYLSLLYMSIL